MATNNSVNTSLSGQTGTGSFVGSTSPTLVTPVLGTPASGNGTNLTNTGGLKSFQIFTSGVAQTYTRPAGITSILVEVLGGGGGGGGVAANGAGTAAVTGGGGSGGYARLWIASAATTYTYTVAGAGAGGAAGANFGASGGTTTFGASLQATGGTGANGATGTTLAAFVPGGVAGVGSSGDFNCGGEPGRPGLLISAGAATYSGDGGSSIYGGGAIGSSVPAAGNNAQNYGSGGSGATTGTATNRAGGNGSAGLIIVWEFA